MLKYLKIRATAVLIAFLAEVVGCGVAGTDFAAELAHDGESVLSASNQDDLPDPLKAGSSRLCNHGCAGHASSHLQAVTQQTNSLPLLKYSGALFIASVGHYTSALTEPTYKPPRLTLIS